jgi:hypothetical protein
MPAAEFPDRNPGFGFEENTDDLFVGKDYNGGLPPKRIGKPILEKL